MADLERHVRLTVIGAGHLGLTHAVSLAELRHDVLVVDIDEHRIALAAGGEAPFYEPGLEPLLRCGREVHGSAGHWARSRREDR